MARERRAAAIREAVARALVSLDGGIDPVDRVADVPLLEAAVGDISEGLIGDARAAGASWADIAERLGVSRQAAHKRFGQGRRRGVRLQLRFERRDDG